MKKILPILKKLIPFFVVLLIVVLAVGAYKIYRNNSNKVLDEAAFTEFRDAVNELEESEAGGFTSQDELRTFIKDWADSHSLEYTEDKAGNIIFDTPAAKRKKNVTPTLVAVSMNYETATSNASLLASAASIALSDVESGRRTVIFFNNEKDLRKGYRKVSKKYISDNSKVIYMDQGSSFYLSTRSFREVFSETIVPAEREENTLDAAVRVTITGIDSGELGPGVSKQPDPVQAIGTLMTRLKSKSTISRLADLKIESNGNMYPTGAEATFVMNSYSVGSFTAYIEKRIKAWEKAYGDKYENLEYKYEVINDAESLPVTVYTEAATDALTSVLYITKTGTYRYNEGDSIPEGKSTSDLYGISSIRDVKVSDEDIRIQFIIAGYDEMFTDRINTDNAAAAELYGCSYETTASIDEFVNDRNSLERTFLQTYKKVNKKISPSSSLESISDNYFTPCSYLTAKNGDADIIHIRINSSNAANIANTVLCYIKAKGNTSIFG